MAPFSLCYPAGGPTPMHSLRVRVMGSENMDGLYSYQSWPQYEVGSGSSAPPVAFVSSSHFDLERVKPLTQFLQSMRNCTAFQQVETLLQLSQCAALRALLTDPCKCYPVLQGNGGREFIGMKWKDVYNFFNGQEDPLLVSCPNVLDALTHMLLRGEDLASARQIAAELDALNAEMSAIKLDNAAQSQILPELPQPALPRSPAPSRQSTSTVFVMDGLTSH
ncbi:hypothetical protein BC835DRAFT_1422552 [Cytidiella melzeri]|nr:hypothetical protein BC835DRAFT_1422552 [Cytidiella melzeri]